MKDYFVFENCHNASLFGPRNLTFGKIFKILTLKTSYTRIINTVEWYNKKDNIELEEAK